MGRHKGGKNKHWSKDEKLRIVNRVLQGDESIRAVARVEKIGGAMIGKWVKKYLEEGEESLQNKNKQASPLIGFINKKNLTQLEELELENIKLKIENERLKKGYKVKGVGQKKEFISISKKNLK